MKQQAFMNVMKEYSVKAKGCHVKPTKGIDNGAGGKLAETFIKLLLENTRGKGVSPAGLGYDTIKKINGKMTTIEIKSGCGELAKIVNDVPVFKSAKYICYCPFSGITDIKCYKVFETEVFISLLESAGLIRLKISTAEYKAAKAENRPPKHDRLTIQTFSNSAKKMTLMDNIMSMGMSVNSFFDI